jgi:outer membrane immunogenic protein
LYNQENTEYFVGPPRVQITDTWTNGGRGWFGTVQGGCDYQFSQFVIGAFADYDFSDIEGRWGNSGGGRTGNEKQSSSWAAGGRIGWVALPNFLTYFSAGYTQAHFD